MVVDFVVVVEAGRFVAAAVFFAAVFAVFVVFVVFAVFVVCVAVRRAGVGAGRATSAACSARNDS